MERTGALPMVDVTVPASWVDYNRHMNDAAYAGLFSRAIDALMNLIGLDELARARHSCSIFTVNMHVRYLQECVLGNRLHVEAQLLDKDSKRLHVLMGAWREERPPELAATAELMLICVNIRSRRAATFPEPVMQRILELWESHRKLPRPREVGQGIGIPRRR